MRLAEVLALPVLEKGMVDLAEELGLMGGPLRQMRADGS